MHLSKKMHCRICDSSSNKILELPQSQQVTSLGRLIDGQASIYQCSNCSHCQTETNINLSEYYSSDYKTLMHSADEDDVYKIVNGRPIWRAEHMSTTFISKLKKISNFSASNRINFLDFGTGKGLFPKTVAQKSPQYNLHLYDVSRNYISSWETFCDPSRYSCYEFPSVWQDFFDVVTSMFSLEHVVDPLSELKKISSLLRPDGFLYIVVPNMYSENMFDMVVVDHIHHYSECSMLKALEQAGLSLVEADHVSHEQASIYIAQRRCKAVTDSVQNFDIDKYLETQNKISMSFSQMSHEIIQFSARAANIPLVVVGAGVIGTYVKSVLDDICDISMFIDSNIYKQSKGWLSLPVNSPSSIPKYETENQPYYIIAHNSRMIPLALEMIPSNVPKERILLLF